MGALTPRALTPLPFMEGQSQSATSIALGKSFHWPSTRNSPAMESSGGSIHKRISVDSKDVLLCIEQYLLENGLQDALLALIKETNVRLPGGSKEVITGIVQTIKEGKWDLLLKNLQVYSLDGDTLFEIFLQIVGELAEEGLGQEAIAFVRNCEDLDQIRAKNPKKYRKLEAIAFNFDEQRAFKLDDPQQYSTRSDTLKQCRREELADKIANGFKVVPSSRLLTIIGASLKHKQYLGHLPLNRQIDLFCDRTVGREQCVEEKPPKRKVGKIKLGKSAYPCAAMFLLDGSRRFCTGGYDGMIEVFDTNTFKHAEDLPYQNEQRFMFQPSSPIQSMAGNRDSTLLATGGVDGSLRIWKIKNGATQAEFKSAHSMGIASLKFSSDSSQLVTCSLDQSIRLWGLNSNKMINEFRGHRGFVNTVAFSEDGFKLFSGSSDGSIITWDIASGACISTLGLGNSTNINASVVQIEIMKRKRKGLIVCRKTSTIDFIDFEGEIVQQYSLPQVSQEDSPVFSNVFVSHFELILHAISNGFLYSYDINSGNLLNVLNLRDGVDVLGICRDPFSNFYCSFGKSGKCFFWE